MIQFSLYLAAAYVCVPGVRVTFVCLCLFGIWHDKMRLCALRRGRGKGVVIYLRVPFRANAKI